MAIPFLELHFSFIKFSQAITIASKIILLSVQLHLEFTFLRFNCYFFKIDVKLSMKF